MLDMKLVRSNPELVKENIKKKFQDEKLPLVDEVLALDEKFRASKAGGTSCGSSATRSAKRSASSWARGRRTRPRK